MRMGAVWKTPRTLRLGRDFKDMVQLRQESTILEFETQDDPPEKYLVTFHGKSLVPKGDGVALGDRQQIEIRLGADYPRSRPDVKWLSPVAHPNIFNQGVCFGSFQWTPFYSLVNFVEILWDYARLAILNPFSAGPGGRPEVDEWHGFDKRFVFPVDKRPLRDRVLGDDAGSSVMRPAPGDKDDIVIMEDGPEGPCPE